MATSELLSEVHSLFAHIATNTGKTLHQWTKGLQVMLLKEAGNLRAGKLGANLLIEPDYNWMYKLMINKRIIPRSEELGLIPEE